MRPVHQIDGQPQVLSGLQFSFSARAARVFGHQGLNRVFLHQGDILLWPKRAATDHDLGMGNGQGGRGRIDQPHQISMLGLFRKMMKLGSTDGQKNILGWCRQGANQFRKTWKVTPGRLGLCIPRRALKTQPRQVQSIRSCHHILGDLLGKRMRGVNDMGDFLRFKPLGQSRGTAKTANPSGQRLWQWVMSSSCIREDGFDRAIGQGFGEMTCLRRAAQKEDAEGRWAIGDE